jgi:hypothetical protein
MKILKKLSTALPEDGYLTMKTSTDNKLNNVIYYNQQTSKIIDFNIVSPELLDLIPNENPFDPPKSDGIIVKRKVGRPRRTSSNDMKIVTDLYNSNQPKNQTVFFNNKYGRAVKLSGDVAKILRIDEMPNVQSVPQITHNMLPEKNEIQVIKEPPKKQRKISSEFRCLTCKKVYLGKNKMNHHLKLHPDHRAFCNESSLFSHLLKLVRQKKTNQEMADIFFKELSSFVTQVSKFTPKLITNNPNNYNVHHHKIDKNSASILAINPGEYKINMNVFDRNFKFDNSIEEQQEKSNEVLNGQNHELEDHDEVIVNGHEVIKALDDVPSLDGNEVNLLIRQTNELTNLTNISDIIINDAKIEHEGDNALLGFLN